MSRIAPTIPVDLNSRRVLVDDLATRLPRCDCCPEVLTPPTCADCTIPFLSAEPPFARRLSVRVGTPFFEPGFTATETGRRRFRNCGFLFGLELEDGDLPNDRPFSWGPNDFSGVALQVNALPVPGGGFVQTVWESSIAFTMSPPPGVFLPLLNFSVNLQVWLLGDSPTFLEGDDFRLFYTVWIHWVLGAGIGDGFNPLPQVDFPPTWFEQGMLPLNEPFCAPDIFPLRLTLPAAFNPEIDVTVTGYEDA